MALRFSDEQIKEAYEEAGSKAGGARLLGMDPRNYRRRLNAILTDEARKGWAPENDLTHPTAPGFRLRRATTLYGKDGELKLQWLQMIEDPAYREEAMRGMIEALSSDIPREPAAPAPAQTNERLCNTYIITDYHIGMAAIAEETGADWDMDIAERLLLGWFGEAIASAPDAELGVLAELGDFLHWDGLEAVTPTNKHVLDAATRFSKLVNTTIRVLRQIIHMLLRKHKRVHVLLAEGNHDPAASIWLRALFPVLYENEPRVTFDTNPDPYYCVEWGQTSIFFHHGHKKAMESIDSVFAAKFREVFGRTKHSYAHMGHLHHNALKETNLKEVERHRTLAAPDAHAARGGWISGREAKVITYDREFGHRSRVVISADSVFTLTENA